MKVLLTYFEPFGGHTLNASAEAVKRLPATIGGGHIITVAIPTVFGKSMDALRCAIDEHRPDVVLCIGQAGGRSGITPERVAINIMDAKSPDNAGNQPQDMPIEPDGPAAYFSTLPIREMVQAMNNAGIPASISNTAGTYVCNQLMYGLLHLQHTHYPNMRAGFIHVPCLPEQVAAEGNQPSMALQDMVRGLIICTEEALSFRN